MKAALRAPFVLACLALPATAAAWGVEPHAGMLRYPDVSARQIAFLYANDLWLVDKEGGTAVPLASPPGEESYPRFSPDGGTLAFVGNYDGNSDLYTVPVAGGVPFRVTHHPATEVLTDWTPDGRLIYFAGGTRDYPRAQELFTVPAGGGLPVKMPVPYGANGSVSADGKWLAYTPHSRDHRTWKRYRGGMATDIWLFHLEDHASKRITDWEGTDTQPMWHGNRVYYLSDAGPTRRLNIRVYDTVTGETRQVTAHEDYDVKWPAIGPDDGGGGEIVYQLGPELRLLDLGSGESRPVPVTIPGARPRIRPRAVDVAGFIEERAISPTGKRAVVEARGDIWTLPASKGSPRNLTRTSGVAERDPAWSPDGKSIAWFSDAGGEYELYVAPADGVGEARRLTEGAGGYLYGTAWSPDSKWLTYWDQAGRLFLVDAARGERRELDQTPDGGRRRVAWSADSRWLAWSRESASRQPDALFLFRVDTGVKHQVTHGMFYDTWPVFDREGKYLYLASQREVSEPIYEDFGTTWIYAHSDRLYLVPLRDDVPSPLLPKSDEEGESEEKDDGEKDEEASSKKKDKKAKKGDKAGKDEEEEAKEEKPEPVEIDLEGFERRMVPLPVERGNFLFLAVNDEGKLIYGRFPTAGFGLEPSIEIFDPEAEDEDERVKTVIEGAGRFAISADGKKLLVVDDETMAIVDARPDQKLDDPISTAGMTATIDPREEWRQIFREAWRVQRDFFYDPGMHGNDWVAIRERYRPMVDEAASREDLSYVIREMISELNVGHAYYFGGDVEEEPEVAVGMPGADFELHEGAYRIQRILEGGPWDADARGPLSQPGVDVREGDYLLAVNGAPVDPGRDPWAAFQGLAGRVVTLTVSERPALDDRARRVVVELPGSEEEFRYRSWVEKNRRYVEEQTGGRVGYIYVPNTGTSGQSELVRQFLGQRTRDALIIDERWNGGGQVPTRFIELLNRPLANYWSLRYGEDLPWPPDAHFGPKCMLINGLAGSGGDYFPYWFKEAGLGKLIGTRTWGGLVGIGGSPRLIDGGITTAPNFAFYRPDGRWGIEGHGVDPDIEVVDDPAAMVGGKDPQLDAAIAHMLEELERNPYRPPAPPAYPDRSGFGVAPGDH